MFDIVLVEPDVGSPAPLSPRSAPTDVATGGEPVDLAELTVGGYEGWWSGDGDGAACDAFAVAHPEVVLHDHGLAGVPHSPIPVRGHALVAREEIRVEARREVPIQEPDADDLRLLDDQVVGQPLRVGERSAVKRVLHREANRRAGDAHAQVELGPPLPPSFAVPTPLLPSSATVGSAGAPGL